MALHPLSPSGWITDPPGAKCPYCKKTQLLCSYVDGTNRAWGREVCRRKTQHTKSDI